MKSAVVVFPGINRERDMARTLKLVSGTEPSHGLARRHRAAGRHRSRGHPRRLLLRRLSALRRDRGARADHGCGAGACRRAAGSCSRVCNGFQICLRVGAAAGRADAQRGAEIHLQGCLSAGRALRHAVHARLQCRPGDPRAGGARRGQLRRGRGNRRAAGRRGPGGVPLRRAGRPLDPRGTSTARPTPLPAS